MCPPIKSVVELEKKLAKIIHDNGKKPIVLTEICRAIDESKFKVNFLRIDFKRFCKTIDIFYQARQKLVGSEFAFIKLEFKQLYFWTENLVNREQLKGLFICTTPLSKEFYQESLRSLVEISDNVNLMFRSKAWCPPYSACFKQGDAEEFEPFDFYVFLIMDKKKGDTINSEFKWNLQ